MSRASVRSVLDLEKPLVTPLAHDAMSARLIERAGFRAFSVGGSAMLVARHALPDIGLAGHGEMVEGLRDIAGGSSLPFIADGDDGYGGPPSVARTVRSYEQIGVGGILIEDQLRDLKRPRAEKAADVADEAVIAAKLQAAMHARENPETFIIGRTDAYGPLGLDAAIRRAEMFLKLGVDGVFVAGLKKESDFERVGAALKGAPYVSAAMFGMPGTPWLTPAELYGLGFTQVSYPAYLVAHAALAMESALKAMREAGASGVPRPTNGGEARRVLDDVVELSRWSSIGA